MNNQNNNSYTVQRNGTYYKQTAEKDPKSEKAIKYLPFAVWGFGLIFTLINSFLRPSLTLSWVSAIILLVLSLGLTVPVVYFERKAGIKRAYIIGFAICHVIAFLLPFVVGAACETVYMWFTAIGGVFLYELNYRELPAKKRGKSLTNRCIMLFGITSVVIMVIMAFVMPMQSGIRYRLNSKGEYSVIATSNVGRVEVADEIRGKAVTGVNAYAFSKNVFTKEVFLPSSITKMAYLSFSGMENVEKLTISPASIPEGMMYTLWYSKSEVATVANTLVPESIKKITVRGSVTDNCFGLLTNLEEVEFIGNVKKIGTNAFAGCTSLKAVVIPEGVTVIDTYAFSYCRSLKDVTLPESLTTINSFVFQYCTALREITIPKNVTTMGAFVFDNCTTGMLSVDIKLSQEEVANLSGWSSSGYYLWMYKATEYDESGNPTNWTSQAFKSIKYAVYEPVIE